MWCLYSQNAAKYISYIIDIESSVILIRSSFGTSVKKPVHKSRFNCCKLDSFVILIWLDSDIYLIRSLENRLRWVNSGIRTLSLSSLYLIHSVFSSRSFTISHMICQRIDHVICPFNAMILVLNTFSYPIPIWYQLIPHS